MACNPILPYSNTCNKSTVAGVAQLYLIGYNSLVNITGSTEVYAVSVNNMVNQIGLADSAKYSKIGILPKAVAIKNPYAFDAATGVSTISEEFTLPVSNVGVDSRGLVTSLLGQPVSALIKLTSGTWIALGLSGMMYVTAVDTEISGTANSYTITFNGTSGDLIPILDPTIVVGLTV